VAEQTGFEPEHALYMSPLTDEKRERNCVALGEPVVIPTRCTEDARAYFGAPNRLDFCRKARIAMGVGWWTWPPAGALRARPAICGALGRASVNSGAPRTNGAQTHVDPFSREVPES
jgi:hypothetical protein